MFYNGQIVHNTKTDEPTKVGGTPADTEWAYSNINNTVHYVSTEFPFLLVRPATIEEAKILLSVGCIRPYKKTDPNIYLPYRVMEVSPTDLRLPSQTLKAKLLKKLNNELEAANIRFSNASDCVKELAKALEIIQTN